MSLMFFGLFYIVAHICGLLAALTVVKMVRMKEATAGNYTIAIFCGLVYFMFWIYTHSSIY